MDAKAFGLVIGIGSLTAVTLAGSFFLLFSNVIALSQTTLLAEDLILPFFVSFIVITFCAGGLWGYGIGRLLQTDASLLARTGALAWGITAVAGGTAVSSLQGPLISAARTTPLDLHTLFTLAVVPTVGLVAAINARVMVGKLGMNSLQRKAMINVGLAAAAGFLIMDLILWFGFGWEVGRPVPGRYSMVTITNLCNFVAALAGGLAMGWTLVAKGATARLSGVMK